MRLLTTPDSLLGSLFDFGDHSYANFSHHDLTPLYGLHMSHIYHVLLRRARFAMMTHLS